MSVQDLALQRHKYKHLSDEEWRWFLQQVEGRERTADKLPTFAQIADWWYPVRLSCEQCSSELTARYKAIIVESRKSKGAYEHSEERLGRMVDLTGGYGVDTLFLSDGFAQTDYVERDAELCRIMAHNCKLATPSFPEGKVIKIHNCSAEEFLSDLPSEISHQPSEGGQEYSLIFMDPARRDSHGGKVFKLADCTPNVVELLPSMMEHLASDGQIMLKLSPMVDISQAVKELSAVSCQHSNIKWDVFVVAVKNEVKEVILCTKGQCTMYEGERITAIDLAEPEKAFTFTRDEEQAAETQMVNSTLSNGNWIYEPNAAILKAGAYKLVGTRFGLQKLDVNTHLYASEQYVPNFPGRVWRISSSPEKGKEPKQANVVVRNYPLTAEQLKKKLKVKDGGEAYIIGCRVKGKPTLFCAERV